MSKLLILHRMMDSIHNAEERHLPIICVAAMLNLDLIPVLLDAGTDAKLTYQPC